jgi:hypothetical protein
MMAKVERTHNTINRAKELGTYNAMDRSRQYEVIDNGELLRAINGAWTKIRTQDTTKASKDEITELRNALGKSRTINTVLTLALIGLWEIVKFLATHGH